MESASTRLAAVAERMNPFPTVGHKPIALMAIAGRCGHRPLRIAGCSTPPLSEGRPGLGIGFHYITCRAVVVLKCEGCKRLGDHMGSPLRDSGEDAERMNPFPTRPLANVRLFRPLLPGGLGAAAPMFNRAGDLCCLRTVRAVVRARCSVRLRAHSSLTSFGLNRRAVFRRP